MSSRRVQHYNVTSCKQRDLTVNIIGAKVYQLSEFGKVFSINEDVIAFSKKVHV